MISICYNLVNFAAPVAFITTGVALAAAASLMFFLAKKAFQWTGVVSIVAGSFAVVRTANLGFRAICQTASATEAE